MQKTIGKIVDFVVGHIEPERVILFGSMATSKNNVNSDIDLLVIVNNAGALQGYPKLIEGYCKELSVSADVLIYSKSELERAMAKENSFIAAILKSGKIIYEQNIEKFA
jgi:uncharacterized protein